jgi:hypothetical protein
VTRLSVWSAEGARRSLEEALAHVSARERVSLRARLAALIERRLDNHPMPPSSWVREGGLPHGSGSFYAIRKLPLRCYCWVEDGTLCISHYIYKNRQKLDATDARQVEESWRERRRSTNQRGSLQ